ncbi:hypothetical protein [Cuniculiplasma divulgatum]|uniref:CaCA family Ca2+/Na+ antiporter n=1 Tax=Cuniculiplasma divulgatum TaxID=1673428 RepID=A0A1R4A895_9ARCH|nr:hypothetical protein [Cuniculiplasma divulgatum]SJK85140.1 CaCA family Ca2+/Na+ antiporter [Cuniculiplasma divulgatum]
MNRKQNFLILAVLLIAGSIVFFTREPVIIIIFIIAIIFGLDMSSDELYEEIEKITGRKPGLFYGLTLFSFLTSFDEIAVSASSIAEGYPGISIGTLVGSIVVTLLIFLVILKFSRTKIEKRYAPFLLIAPVYILLLVVLHMEEVPVILLLTIVTIGISFFAFYYLSSKERIREVKVDKKEKQVIGTSILELIIFVVSILVFSLYLSRGTASMGIDLNIGEVNSGYIIPGILGSIPEIVVIKSSIKRNDSKSVAGIITGSTVIKGGILLPLLAFVFNYTPAYDNITISGSVAILIITIILIFL